MLHWVERPPWSGERYDVPSLPRVVTDDVAHHITTVSGVLRP